jgi:hypothetical protein
MLSPYDSAVKVFTGNPRMAHLCHANDEVLDESSPTRTLDQEWQNARTFRAIPDVFRHALKDLPTPRGNKSNSFINVPDTEEIWRF